MDQQILFPTDHDVLMGQSPNLRSHPGNARLKELVATKFDEYCAASKLDKTRIAETIIRDIQDEGRRFLKQPQKRRIGSIYDALWVLENDSVRIRDKIASQFRGHLKERNRKQYDSPQHINISKENQKPRPSMAREEIKKRNERNLPLKKRIIHSYKNSRPETPPLSNEPCPDTPPLSGEHLNHEAFVTVFRERQREHERSSSFGAQNTDPLRKDCKLLPYHMSTFSSYDYVGIIWCNTKESVFSNAKYTFHIILRTTYYDKICLG